MINTAVVNHVLYYIQITVTDIGH